jgi:hypothetical protein
VSSTGVLTVVHGTDFTAVTHTGGSGVYNLTTSIDMAGCAIDATNNGGVLGDTVTVARTSPTNVFVSTASAGLLGVPTATDLPFSVVVSCS